MLEIGAGFDETIFQEKADDERHAMLTQPSRVNGGDAELMTHSVYFSHRLRPGNVAPVVA